MSSTSQLAHAFRAADSSLVGDLAFPFLHSHR